jgi:hypothetical protein
VSSQLFRGGLETRCEWALGRKRCGPIDACDRGCVWGARCSCTLQVPCSGGLGEGGVGHLSLGTELVHVAFDGCVSVRGGSKKIAGRIDDLEVPIHTLHMRAMLGLEMPCIY